MECPRCNGVCNGNSIFCSMKKAFNEATLAGLKSSYRSENPFSQMSSYSLSNPRKNYNAHGLENLSYSPLNANLSAFGKYSIQNSADKSYNLFKGDYNGGSDYHASSDYQSE